MSESLVVDGPAETLRKKLESFKQNGLTHQARAELAYKEREFSIAFCAQAQKVTCSSGDELAELTDEELYALDRMLFRKIFWKGIAQVATLLPWIVFLGNDCPSALAYLVRRRYVKKVKGAAYLSCDQLRQRFQKGIYGCY